MQDRFAAVVGAINIDISGTPDSKMILGDSNPGEVASSLGGVGRNIAENLVRLGMPCHMVTALGDDMHLPRIQESCRAIGIDLSASEVFPSGRNSTYLCINDIGGDIVTAIADMAICEKLTPEFLEKRLDLLNRADFVVLDANLPPASCAFLADYCLSPLIGDTVSIKKAGRLGPALWKMDTIKPNRPEAELLTGIPIRGTQGLDENADFFLRQGVRHVFISLGSQGVFFADAGDRGIQPCLSGTVRNTNGCGDAFLAACSLALRSGHPIREAARIGQAGASLCAEAETAVSPDLTRTLLEKRCGITL